MNSSKFKSVPVTKPSTPTTIPRSPFTKPDMSGAKQLSPAEARARLKEEERRAAARAALAVPNPDSGVRSVTTDDTDLSSFLCPIDQLREYEHNPRRRSSEALAALKASIAAKGIQQIITVTKRPGQDYYIPYSGGNSRLRCAKELYAERGPDNDYAKFAMLRVVYRAWTSESDVYAAHIAENEVRADIPFWDKAHAAMELKRLIEEEEGRTLSTRELERIFAAKGIPGAHTSIAYFSFACSRLAPLGEAGYFISRTQVRERIQPAFVRWDALAKRAGRETEYRALLDQELQAIGTRALMSNALEADTLIGEAEEAIARFYGVDRARLQRMIQLADGFDLDFEQLLAQSEEQPRPPRTAAYAPEIPGVDEARRREIVGQRPDPAIARGQRNLLPPAPVEQRAAAAAPDDPGTRVASTAEAAHAPEAGSKPASGATEDVRELLGDLLEPCGLTDCLVSAPEMPLGWIVDVPASGLTTIHDFQDPDERRLVADRRLAWWIGSMVCRQHTEHGMIDRLPPSRWRDHVTGKLNPDPEDIDDVSYLQQFLFQECGGEPTLYELTRFLWQRSDTDRERRCVRAALDLLLTATLYAGESQ